MLVNWTNIDLYIVSISINRPDRHSKISLSLYVFLVLTDCGHCWSYVRRIRKTYTQLLNKPPHARDEDTTINYIRCAVASVGIFTSVVMSQHKFNASVHKRMTSNRT